MGTGATVTWSLMGTGTSCAAEFAGCTITSFADFMPAGYLTQVSNAFAAWSAVATSPSCKSRMTVQLSMPPQLLVTSAWAAIP